jgi:dienelactone hydrolase
MASTRAFARARRESFREEAVTVGAKGDWPLPGTLALPRGKGPFPGVALLHGSGPNDRDQTIGPNKPLRDLAWGLATKGIAVLRFDKRSRVHGEKMVKSKTPTTLKEEVIDDALLAVKLLRERKEIDPRRVFVLGHSLGAMAAPRVGRLDSSLRGLILLAGNSRPLEDLILDQFRHQFSLEGGPTKEQKEQLGRIEKQVARVKDPKLSADVPAREMPLGIPAAYWLALREYDQKAVAAKLPMPLLVLQGERDYQVTMEDFAGWKKALAFRKGVTLKSYPRLNHLFMAGVGKSKPAEYARAGHVAGEVVDDVAAWVKKR